MLIYSYSFEGVSAKYFEKLQCDTSMERTKPPQNTSYQSKGLAEFSFCSLKRPYLNRLAYVKGGISFYG